MRKIIALWILFSACAYGENQLVKVPTLADVVKEDHWTLVERKSEDTIQYIRFRKSFTSDMDFTQLPKGIHVFWDFKADRNGMPADNSVLVRMAEFENNIIQNLEKDLSGVLVSVLTMDGYRQWTFCVKDSEVFFDRLNSMSQTGEPYPLEFENADGSGWNYYFEIADQFK